jgi:ABC-type transport system substrate-binding protein
LGLLSQAGYEIDAEATPAPAPAPPSAGSRTTEAPTPAPEMTRGRVIKDGVALSLVLGVAANDPTAVAVANTAADQLRSVGISASVLAVDPPVLYGDALVNNRVDAVIGWHRAGGDLATSLASRYGCPALEATPVATSPTATPTTTTTKSSTSSKPPPSTASTTPTPTSPTTAAGALVQAPSNITGICDRNIQPRIDAALDGHVDISDVINAVEPRLWDMATVLPILQDTTIVAAGPSVQNVSLSGAVPVGIVADANRWVKTPQ